VKALAEVVGVGARTAVGLTARQTAFLLRAGAAGFHDSPLLDHNDELVTIGSVPVLDPLSVGADRVRALALAALEEALEPLSSLDAPLRLRVLLALEPALANGRVQDEAPAQRLASDVRRRLRKMGHQAEVDALPTGAAAPCAGLIAACEALARGEADALLLGGSHSDYDPAIVRALSEQGRLFGSGKVNGIIPGECAAFVLLALPSVARKRGLEVRAHFHAAGLGFEKASADNDEPAFRALGLTHAIRGLGAAMDPEGVRAGWLLSDMTAETHRVSEWQAAYVRTQALWCDPQCIEAPAHRLGRLGAAALPLHVALAATAWRHSFAPHSVAISLVGSESGERGATLWSAPAS
jgi:3-oxoacyl-[acyl-carrier-protein] synthase-1